MIERYPFWLPLAVLGFLALLTFWLSQSIKDAGARNKANVKDPDSIVENFTAISTDLAGVPRYQLAAVRLKHFSDSKTTLLDKPVLVNMHAKYGDMKVLSNLASVAPEGEKVTFIGDVQLSRKPLNSDIVTVMKTSYLDVFPDKGLVTTRKPLTIERPGMLISANGIDMSANTRILKLTGRVKVQYQPRGHRA